MSNDIDMDNHGRVALHITKRESMPHLWMGIPDPTKTFSLVTTKETENSAFPKKGPEKGLRIVTK